MHKFGAVNKRSNLACDFGLDFFSFFFLFFPDTKEVNKNGLSTDSTAFTLCEKANRFTFIYNVKYKYSMLLTAFVALKLK